MINDEVRIEYTETFNNLLNDLIDHLSPYSSEEQVIIRIEDFIERFEDLISFTSTAAPISQPLLELGVRTFREFTADGFRLLYRIKEEANSVRVIGDIIISQKQDIQQLLINYCLLHK
ncbi:MAG: type II toxin-antitoxin system RelE/ParE family toxin [Colwellia sp.]